MTLLIKNGRVVDPGRGLDETLDILIADGKIGQIRARIDQPDVPTIDASRLVVAPGLIDMHVHLREPGHKDKETIAAGSRAAARGGFTTVCCMPNTRPVNDQRSVTEVILAEAARTAVVHVLPVASVTKGSKGEEVVDMAGLLAAGSAAFSDDGQPVMNSRVMRKALETAKSLGALIIDHCEDKNLSKDGVMNEGPASSRFGLRGIPAAAEEVMIARDIVLAAALGTRVHIAHLSTRGGVEAVRAAKARGIRVTAEATPHHLVLTDEALEGHNPDYKMNPPLRSREDVDALIEALRDGTVDVLATDHAPHTAKDKGLGILKAPFGIVGLETAVSVVLDRIVHRNMMSLGRFIEAASVAPARILGLRNKGVIAEGAEADLTLLNLSKESIVDRNRFESKGRNTPFEGWKLRGAPAMTIVGGRVVFPFDFVPSAARP